MQRPSDVQQQSSTVVTTDSEQSEYQGYGDGGDMNTEAEGERGKDGKEEQRGRDKKVTPLGKESELGGKKALHVIKSECK